jgi:uncharacterized LabA/DUF88 family protein
MFIDGAYLRSRIEDAATRYSIDKDRRLVGDLDCFCQFIRGRHEKVFFYDCLPLRRSGEDDLAYGARVTQAEESFSLLRRLPGFHVFLGNAKSEGAKARQKGVDVQLAVHMLMHVFRKNVRNVTLVTGDLDFKPLIDALVLEGAYVTLRFEQTSAAKELIEAADEQAPFWLFEIAGWGRRVPAPATVDFASGPIGSGYESPMKSGYCSGNKAVLYKNETGNFTLAICQEEGRWRNIRWSSEDLVMAVAAELGLSITW